MTWLKVSDSFHSHPKVLSCSPAAIGLWVIAGSWSAANLTEGFIPNHVLPRLISSAAKRRANELVSAGLWVKFDDGFAFKDWSEYQPSKESVESQRRATADRQKRWREGRKGKSEPGGNAHRNGVTHGVTNGVSNDSPRDDAPTRPDPTNTPPTPPEGGTPHAPSEHEQTPETSRPEAGGGETLRDLVQSSTGATEAEADALIQRIRDNPTVNDTGGYIRSLADRERLGDVLADVRAAARPRIRPRDEWMYRN